MYPTPVQRVTSNGGTARAKQYGFSGFCVFDCFYARGLEAFQIYCNGRKTAHCSVWFGLMILLSVGDFPVSGFCHQAFPDGLLVYAFGSHPFGRFLHGVFFVKKRKSHFGHGSDCLVDAFHILLLVHVNAAKRGASSVQVEIINSADHY